eukprot:2971394-Rhodomonas_salina.2
MSGTDIGRVSENDVGTEGATALSAGSIPFQCEIKCIKTRSRHKLYGDCGFSSLIPRGNCDLAAINGGAVAEIGGEFSISAGRAVS